MKNQRRPYIVRARGALPVRALGLMVATLLLWTGVAAAKSVYVITEITSFDRPTPIHAYDIGPDGLLTFQAEVGAPFLGAGTIGLALDANSEQLFVTFENANVILALDSRTLQGPRSALAPDAEDLAGIVYDHGRERLYCVDRRTENLYVYLWEPERPSLRSVSGSPFQLEGATAYGLALDENNDLLYVGNGSREITVYSTEDWRRVQTIPVSRTAISVAIDPVRGYLYYGGGFAGNFHLVQYNLAANGEKEVEIAADAGVMGLGVDPASGMIYVTTGQNQRPGGDDLLVFDTNLSLLQTLEDIGNPTGLVVPAKDTGYNPLRLAKAVQTPFGGEPNDRELPRIVIGDDFTYTVSFDHDGYDLTEISVADRLPLEVTFVDATGHGTFGQYDSKTHIYTWTNPPLASIGRTSLSLVGRLQPDTAPGRIITNLVTLDTDKTPPTTTGVRAIATEATYKPLNISKTVLLADADRSGAGQTIYIQPGEQFAYRICFDNRDNDHTVSDVFVIDDLPDEVDFVGATGDGVFGMYDPLSHFYLWSYPSLSPGESNCVDLVVRLRTDVTAGATITNTVAIESKQTPQTSTTAEVVAGYPALRMRKTITGGAGGEPDDRGRLSVDAGGEVTYSLSFSNPSPDQTVSNIMLVDTLPPEVSFLKAEGDQEFGFYDANSHTYTWFHAPLGPLAEDSLDLVVRVNEQTEPNSIVSNWAVIQSKQTAATKARVDAVVRAKPLAALMFLKPSHIFRNSAPGTASLMVVLHLPEGYGRELIADVPAVLTPGNIRPTSQQIYGTSTQGKLLCFFDTDAILAATEGYGQIELTVTGELRGGRSFAGRCPIYVLKFGGP